MKLSNPSLTLAIIFLHATRVPCTFAAPTLIARAFTSCPLGQYLPMGSQICSDCPALLPGNSFENGSCACDKTCSCDTKFTPDPEKKGGCTCDATKFLERSSGEGQTLACKCKPNSVWNKYKETCMCIEGYYAAYYRDSPGGDCLPCPVVGGCPRTD